MTRPPRIDSEHSRQPVYDRDGRYLGLADFTAANGSFAIVRGDEADLAVRPLLAPRSSIDFLSPDGVTLKLAAAEIEAYSRQMAAEQAASPVDWPEIDFSVLREAVLVA